MPDELMFTTPQYDLFDWYWRADDNRIFASKRRMIVSQIDSDYTSFCEGKAPTPWPRDDNGNQTDAALQAVFDQAEIRVGGVPYDPTVPDAIKVGK